jgi:hypothetical protein
VALLEFGTSGGGNLSKAPSQVSRTPPAERQQSTWRRSALEFAGALFVLMGIALSVLMLRYVLVLSHGLLN